MARTPKEKVAAELLRRKSPVTRGRLQEIAGCTSDRELRLVIEDLRKTGLPVMSSPSVAGYWLARDEEELVLHKVLVAQKCMAEMETNNAMAMFRIEEIREDLKNGKPI